MSKILIKSIKEIFNISKKKTALGIVEKKSVLNYPPKWITIGITNICNNRCVFCSYHCDEAKGNSNVYDIPFNMSFIDFKRIVDMAYVGKVSHVHICGTGEPFMNKDILKMIDYTIKIYGKASLQTNFYKPLFLKNNYIEEIIKRSNKISYITTDVLSGNPDIHNEMKKGSSYEDILDSLKILSEKSNININISYVVSKFNYRYMKSLIDDIVERKIKNVFLNIHNLYSYDFNKYTSTGCVYTSKDLVITNALEEVLSYGYSKGIKVKIPIPADADSRGCNVFWEKIQIWPVQGNDPERYHENLIPHACRAVVKGELNSLGYIFDYDNIMEMWNNEKIVEIRRNILKGIYPSKECRYCCHYNGKDSIYEMKKQWEKSFQKHIDEFTQNKIIKELNENSICIDCGANVGSITEIFVKKGSKVFAFEPNPIAFAKLEEKFGNNEKVKIFPKAVSTEETGLKLYMYQYHQDDNVFWSVGASTYSSKDDVDTSSYVEVEAIDLVKFIEELNSDIDILKIDIEGGEYDILLKIIEKGLYKKIKNILVETHDKHIPEIIPKGVAVREIITKRILQTLD